MAPSTKLLRRGLMTGVALSIAGTVAWWSNAQWRVHASQHAIAVPPVEHDYGRQKVVYHISESGGSGGARHLGWLGNMENHYKALATGALDLVVVINGDGIDLLTHARTDPEIAGRIDRLKAKGTRFLICRNTLIGRGLDPAEDLYDVHRDDLVGAGVAEVVALQQLGYVYLKP